MNDFELLLAEFNGGKLRGAQSRLAELLEVRPHTVSQWCGRGRPSKELIPALARALKRSERELLDLFNRKDSVPSGIDAATLTEITAYVPVLGRVAADRFAISFEAAPEEAIPNPFPGKKLFALRVSGDCMEPTFHDGEYVYINSAQSPKHRDVVLAVLDAEYTLKRYEARKDGAWLVPDNKRYKAIKIATSHLVIKGVVVWVARRTV